MNRIKQLREEKQMKQKELAVLLNCADNAVSYYESGQRGLSIELIADLCEIFGVTADYLLGLSSQRTHQIPDEDAALVAAYHAAPDSVRQGIDALLAPYRAEEKENAAAG